MPCSPHICPKCGNTEEFLTVAHVAQTWMVDGSGNFIQEASTDETVHGPDDANVWNCLCCGAEAVIRKD